MGELPARLMIATTSFLGDVQLDARLVSPTARSTAGTGTSLGAGILADGLPVE